MYNEEETKELLAQQNRLNTRIDRHTGEKKTGS